MNELIRTYQNDNGEILVNGRGLHEYLEVKTPYDKWFPRMKDYGFSEGADFSTFLSESTGGRRAADHAIRLDMAKEICMIQKTTKGKEARQYFIKVEKMWNSPDMILKRSREILEARIETMQLEMEEMRPKVLFADAVAASKSSILIGELAKLIKQNGVDIGQNRLFAWLRAKGYLIRRKGTDYNTPTQRAMDMQLFEIKESTYSDSSGNIKITKTAKVTGKGQQYFINKVLEDAKLWEK